jgi:hypothetical protein
MAGEDEQLQALIEATREATRAEERRIALIESLREDFSGVCDKLSSVDELKAAMSRVERNTDIIISWIFAEQSTGRQELENRLRDLRKKTNGLTFPDKAGEPPPSMTLSELRQELTSRLDIEELRTLCFDLGIEYDSLRGEGLEAKVRELVDREQRHDGVGRLRQWLEKVDK